MRPITSTRIGASRLEVARYSMRSRNVDSAQWTSSKTSTTGRSAASPSISRRTAQKISTGEEAASARPSALHALQDRHGLLRAPDQGGELLRHLLGRVLLGDPGGRLEDLADRPERDALAVGQAAALEDRRVVAQGRDELGGEAGLADAGGAQHGTSAQLRSAVTFSSAARSPPSSSSRPASAESSRREKPGARLDRQQAVGRDSSALPLSSSGSTAVTCTASRTRRSVSSPIRISSSVAACSSRAATLTASPVTKPWPRLGRRDDLAGVHAGAHAQPDAPAPRAPR